MQDSQRELLIRVWIEQGESYPLSLAETMPKLAKRMEDLVREKFYIKNVHAEACFAEAPRNPEAEKPETTL